MHRVAGQVVNSATANMSDADRAPRTHCLLRFAKGHAAEAVARGFRTLGLLVWICIREHNFAFLHRWAGGTGLHLALGLSTAPARTRGCDAARDADSRYELCCPDTAGF